jgi:hypothetical protein
MISFIFATLLLQAWSVQSSTIKTGYVPSNAKCVDYDIPVSVSATALNWTGPRWKDNYALTDFVTLAGSRSSAVSQLPFGGTYTLEANYTISATFCTPKTPNANTNTVLLASPGLGYDRRLVIAILII